MKRRFIFFLLTSLTLPFNVANAAPVSVVDDTGQTVTLAQPARRIVSLAPHVTETLFAAGAGAAVVGAVSYSDYPKAAKQIPQVGSYPNVDLERVVSLKPDLVVGWPGGNAPAQLERLRALGLTVYRSDPRRIEDVAANIKRLGVLAGTPAQADAAAAKFRHRHRELAQRYRARPPVTVFYQVWHRPLMTINGAHLISQVIALCGGVNVFTALPALTPTLDVEAVLKADPAVIVASGMDESRPEWLDDWRRWPQLRAVRDGHLYFVPPDLLQRHGPRILDGAEQLCAALDQARAPR
jgi:iron complex transport system substrate-binding protein